MCVGSVYLVDYIKQIGFHVPQSNNEFIFNGGLNM